MSAHFSPFLPPSLVFGRFWLHFGLILLEFVDDFGVLGCFGTISVSIFLEIGNPFQNLPDMFKELFGISGLVPGFVFRKVSGFFGCGGIRAASSIYIYIYI